MSLLSTAQDLEWARQVHNVPNNAKSILLEGNEDSPTSVRWSEETDPTVHTTWKKATQDQLDRCKKVAKEDINSFFEPHRDIAEV